MAVNLSRNTRVYYTNLALTTQTTGYDNTNTWEIQVLNGYQFSQNTEQQTIQITEAGQVPNRGQRSFNTKLNPVEWSFGTYVRPKKFTATVTATSSASQTQSLGVATLNFASAHGFTNGMYVTIAGGSGATGTGFNTLTNSPVPVQVMTGTQIKVPVSVTSGPTCTQALTVTSVARTTSPEKFLWNAALSKRDLYDYDGYTADAKNPAWTEVAGSASLVSTNADAHQLAPFALIFKVDNVYYKICQCAVNQAEIQFGLDQIAQINWSGFGTVIQQFDTTAAQATSLTSITAADTTAQFITNKLSTIQLYDNINAATTTTNTQYTVPITGGTLTINNNLQYLTPEILGTVNFPVGYFTGTRAVSGNLTAYLKTGSSTDTGALMSTIITQASAAGGSENKFSATLHLGGQSNSTRVEFDLPAIMIQVPSIEIQDVVSTTLNFTAQKWTGSNYDLDATNPNELTVNYFSA
jgi:hypothetical protein